MPKEQATRNYWLLKSDPGFFIDELPEKSVVWGEIRNYAARNYLRQMAVGEDSLFYHSNCKNPGVSGIVKIVRDPYPDETAFDKNSKYFDAKSDPENPRWFAVDIQVSERFVSFVSLNDIKNSDSLKEMALVKRPRLSVQPVTAQEFKEIARLGRAKSAIVSTV